MVDTEVLVRSPEVLLSSSGNPVEIVVSSLGLEELSKTQEPKAAETVGNGRSRGLKATPHGLPGLLPSPSSLQQLQRCVGFLGPYPDIGLLSITSS